VDVNVMGTSQMLDAFTRGGIDLQHLVIASSRAVYGEGLWRMADGEVFSPPARRHVDLQNARWDPVASKGGAVSFVAQRADTTPAKPTSVYGATKMAQEMILSAWTASRDIPLSILRMQNVYGPGQSLFNSYTGVVSLFARIAKEGVAIDVYEDGQIVRDFVYIEDVVDAFVAALGRPPGTERIFDVGTGDATTIEELAAAIADHYGAPTPFVSGKFRDGDVRSAVADISLAQTLVEYQPGWKLLDGLRELFAWIDSEVST
jgi:dTDP-L-rhamnose 4-epimerase